MNLKRSLTGAALATIVLVALCAVCATTSVSAANSGSAQASIAGNPIPEGSSPAACSQNGNSLDLFVRGADNACWWRHWDGTAGWGAWKSLGGVLTSSPAAVSREAGYIDIYARGTNGQLYERDWTSSSGWNAWHSLGGQLASNTGPAAAGQPGRVDVFVVGTNGALYWKTWNASSSWSGWTSLGGTLTSSPAAAWHNGYLYVAARGTNGAFYSKTYTSGWSVLWFSSGGQLLPGTGPSVADGITFVTGTNHQLYWLVGPSTWQSLGGYLTSSAASTARSSSYVDVFVRGSNGLIYQKEYSTTSGWSGWSPMQGPP